jgi:2-polyprenyl-3-methyl-5-hydroxy-6-metoxy-1,4-benzoquinol methylase
VDREREDARAKSEDRYFASSSAHDTELDRLRVLEEIHDPATIRRLERIGVRRGWSCLEVAAGGGSIAAWLGDRVGSGGRVVAVDIDTRFLRHLSEPVEVRPMNLLTDDLESGVFDLVHARAILQHLRDPETVLKKMAAAVRPGGWLLIEETDDEGLAGLEGHPEADRFTEDIRSLIHRVQEAGIVDFYFGHRVRHLVEGLGFDDVVAEGDTRIWRGGELGATFLELSGSLLHKAGMATDEEHDRAERLLRDPSFAFRDMVLYGAWGRRPN